MSSHFYNAYLPKPKKNMHLARKTPFFWKAHGIVPGWSRTTNISSLEIERATHCATEKTPCRLAPKILFYSSLYSVQFTCLDLQHCKEG